jgi:undecaprenyl-diphosphatase
MGDSVETFLRDPLVIATSTLVFGLLLWFADRQRVDRSDEQHLNWRQAMVIGTMQVLALIPGTSRSGITITAGLLLGLSRQAAARFSFLLAIPVISAAGVYNLGKILHHDHAVDWYALSLGTLVSFVSAYLCIHYFLKLIERIGMLPFVIYRLLLAAVLFYLFV